VEQNNVVMEQKTFVLKQNTAAVKQNNVALERNPGVFQKNANNYIWSQSRRFLRAGFAPYLDMRDLKSGQ
jgi:hypothetical protein